MSASDPWDRAKAVLAERGLHPNKAFGQNFLTDLRVVDRIADTVLRAGEGPIVEIGPGLGALTARLVASGRPVLAVERDRGMIEALGERFAGAPNLTVTEGDARSFDLSAAFPGQRPVVAGNLPYSVTSPLLLQLVAHRAGIGSAVVMIQREVAERLTAAPGTKAYGSLTVLFALLAEVEIRFDVGSGAFWPPPSVTSSVLRIDWRPEPAAPIESLEHFESVVRAAFSQRRKTLRNTLRGSWPEDRVVAAAEASELDLGRRAETLTVSEFARLASALSARGTPRPA